MAHDELGTCRTNRVSPEQPGSMCQTVYTALLPTPAHSQSSTSSVYQAVSPTDQRPIQAASHADDTSAEVCNQQLTKQLRGTIRIPYTGLKQLPTMMPEEHLPGYPVLQRLTSALYLAGILTARPRLVTATSSSAWLSVISESMSSS